jgi:hypothetical protein
MNNKQNESIYTTDNYTKLINSLKNIKQETISIEHTGLDFRQTIYNAIKEIETISGISPSYKNFLNKLITDENLQQAREKIIDQIIEKEIIGFTPDIKTLVSKLVTEQNIQQAKDFFIQQFKALDI